jgi:hypothetical protein
VSPSAAVCIARAHGLPDGLSAPSVTLVYNSGFRRVVWSVLTVTDNSRSDSVWGAADSIDAVTGAVFENGISGWSFKS